MSTQTKMTRTVRKIEAPRPLKSTTTSVTNRNSAIDVKINSVEELIVLTEAVAYQISQKNFDRNLQTNVETMYQFLKMHGAQLESSYKEVLDRFFIVFRDGSQNEKFDKMSRLHLLELIELRAKHWHTTDYMSEYYRYKVTIAEPLLVPTMDPGMGTSSTSPTPEPAPILGPGELIKASGKFLKPTKIPGKNYSKDEVVIRNADSGKVMGIKGRRVHMIEELSDTIISFQRVSPGAKERLVQITGPNEENVNHAKHLIGDTIRRNASPVRLESTGAELRASDASLSSDDASPRETRTPPANSRILLHSFSTNDAALNEYKHTVSVGQHSIKITGDNLDIVKTAKLVLDEYFENMAALEAGAGSGDFFTLARPGQHTPLTPLVPLLPLTPIPAAELNGANNNDDEVFTPKSPTEDTTDSTSSVRRPRFSRGYSSDKKEGLTPAAASRQIYTSATLLALAESPLSRVPPATAPPPEIARKVCLDYDGAAHLKASNDRPSFVSGEVPDSPEPE